MSFMRSLLIPLLLAGSLSAAEPVIGKISFPLNRVFVTAAGSSGLEYATFNMPLHSGDVIQTRSRSRCEILLDNGDIIRLGENTSASLELSSDTSGGYIARLSNGKLWVQNGPNAGALQYISTPVARLMPDAVTCRISSNGSNNLEIMVYRSTLRMQINGDATPMPETVEGEKPGTEVSAGNQALLSNSKAAVIGPIDAPKDNADEWVVWNRKRNRLLEELKQRNSNEQEYQSRRDE